MVDRRGTLWRAIPWAAGVATLALALPLRAQDGPRVRWIAPGECAGDDRLQREVEALLGRPLAADDAITLDAEVRQEGADRWVVALRRAEDGVIERTLAGESCGALVGAAALVIAWRVDPDLELREVADRAPLAPVEPAPPRSVPRVRRDPAAQLSPPDRAPPRPTPLSLGVGAAFVLDVGTLPEIAPGVAGELVVRIDRLDLRARGGWLATQGARLGNDPPVGPPGAGVDVTWAGGSLHACGRPLDGDEGRPGLALCGGVQIGVLLAQGVGVSDPGRADAPVASLVLGAAMPWVLADALDLEVGLDVSIPLGAPAFELAPFGVVWEPSPIAARLTLGGHLDVR